MRSRNGLSRRTIWIAATILLVVGVAAALVTTSGPPPPRPGLEGTLSFAFLGDAPYYLWEEVQYRLVLQDMDAHELAAVVHVGDIFWRPCTDEHYRRARGRLDDLRHPVIYTPGDNEWTDCWEDGSGAFVPLERLGRMREIFFEHPERSLGRKGLPLASQGGRAPFPELVENARWVQAGIIFATVHLVGSENGLSPRAALGDEPKRRTDAAAAWVREAFAEARAHDAPAVVVAFHANVDLEEPATDPYRQAFDPFLAVLEEEVARFGKPVLAAHGDGHDYTVDHPLIRRSTGERLANFTRLQVPGSPRVGWVRVTFTPGGAAPFAFEERVVPRWKYW